MGVPQAQGQADTFTAVASSHVALLGSRGWRGWRRGFVSSTTNNMASFHTAVQEPLRNDARRRRHSILAQNIHNILAKLFFSIAMT